MSKDIERQIEKIYKEVWKKILNEKRFSAILKRQTGQLNLIVKNLTKSKQYEEFCKKFAKALALKGLNKQKSLWKKCYEAAKKNKLGILESTYSDYEKSQFEAAVKRNFKMIKSIPQDILSTIKEKSVSVVIKQVAEGSLGRKSFERFLKEKGAKHARLIARTETAKLQSAIIEHRATDLGSVCYQWSSTHDKRTRASHVAMNDVIVLWRDKWEERPLLDGMNGNAGEFPNCRCTPEPIFDKDDLTKTHYKVYDYRSHSIISMTKSQVVKLLEKGDF